MDLSRYGSDERPGAGRWAQAIAETVEAGTMPPWLPDPRFDDLLVPPRLTAKEVGILIAWARAGAPDDGKSEATPASGRASREFTLVKPDLTVETAPGVECEVIAGGQGERYRTDLDLQRARWITGLEILPADPGATRLVVAYLESPSSDQEISLVSPDTDAIRSRTLPQGLGFVGQWLPGDLPVLFPDTAGFLAQVGSRVVVDVLLRPGDGTPCAGLGPRLGLRLDRPRQEIDLWLEAHELVAESRQPGQRRAPRAELEGSLELDEDVRLLALYPQISDDLASFEVTMEYVDGRRRTLLLVSDYRPRLAASYPLAEPLPVPAGTTVSIRGHVDRAAGSSTSSSAATPTRLGVVLQYVLADHLIAEAPSLPPDLLAELGYGKAAIDSLGAPAPPGARSRAFVSPQPQLFRADNDYHLIEGSIPAPGVFRLQVKDSDGRGLDPRNFAGELVFQYRDELSETYAASRFRLRPYDRWLWARVPPRLPVAFHVVLRLAGVQRRLDFDFSEPREGAVARRAESQPVVLPPALEVGNGVDARRSLLELLRRQGRELAVAASSGSLEDVSRAARELWRIGMATSRSVAGLGSEAQARLQLAAGELARAGLAAHRIAEQGGEAGRRLQSARERLDGAVAAMDSILGGS